MKLHIIMDEMYVQGDGLVIKSLFLKDSSTLCYSSSFSTLIHYVFSDPLLMEGLSHYIEFSKSSPSYSCSPSNSALKYVSYQASFLTFCEQ